MGRAVCASNRNDECRKSSFEIEFSFISLSQVWASLPLRNSRIYKFCSVDSSRELAFTKCSLFGWLVLPCIFPPMRIPRLCCRLKARYTQTNSKSTPRTRQKKLGRFLSRIVCDTRTRCLCPVHSIREGIRESMMRHDIIKSTCKMNISCMNSLSSHFHYDSRSVVPSVASSGGACGRGSCATSYNLIFN